MHNNRPGGRLRSKSPGVQPSSKMMAGTRSEQALEREHLQAAGQVQGEELDRDCNVCDDPWGSPRACRNDAPLGDPNEELQRTIGCAMALTPQPQLNNRTEAASAQAVNRGHKVVTPCCTERPFPMLISNQSELHTECLLA